MLKYYGIHFNFPFPLLLKNMLHYEMLIIVILLSFFIKKFMYGLGTASYYKFRRYFFLLLYIYISAFVGGLTCHFWCVKLKFFFQVKNNDPYLTLKGTNLLKSK